ncbi:MAG: tryptophan synthase subunit alpha [Gemmatimonadetes bacterium]|jgi:tryptophan synthase alpha chain|nr:tryptophan synthase subunit alpha [Gemmatimonadota bacterium]MBT7860921.1 tryptophan synthase subunit alpha [Gemmatimonadota bacterium]
MTSALETQVRDRLATDERRLLLMTHVIVGYPSLEANRKMLALMGEADVDLVELQMPFSEPVADGPTFVRANQEALANGLRLDDYFDFFEEAGQLCSCPRLMMGYYNTVYRLGHEQFCQRLAQAGGAGFILPDLPIEEFGDLFDLSQRQALDPIMLMTPTNTEQRLQQIGDHARGFVYTVARKGVTGSRTKMEEGGVFDLLKRCRAATSLPLALGFGLSTGDDLRLLYDSQAKIGIVGSALLQAWEEGGESGYARLLAELSDARA